MNTNDTQRIQHLERLVDDATQTMALLRKENERQAAQISALVAENDINLHGAARELNTSWMMHKTMLGAQAALHCLIHGDIRGARDWLEGTTDEAFAEIPDDMTPADIQNWFDKNMTSSDGNNGFLTYEEALNKLRQRTPATSSVISAIRAEDAKWIEGAHPEQFGRYWVRYETDVGPQYCSAEWMEYNFCASSNTNIRKIWLADHSRSINPLHGVTHYTKLPEPIEGGFQ